MKKCEICEVNEGTIRLTEVVNGTKTQRWVCEDCSEGQLQMISKLLSDFTVGGVASPPPEASTPPPAPVPENVDPLYMGEFPCEKCGMTHKELMKVQKLGCSDCYQAFEKILEATLRRIHGETQHRGKTPSEHKWSIEQLETRIASLEEQMDKAAKAEAYDKAAEARDQIKLLRVQREQLLKEQE